MNVFSRPLFKNQFIKRYADGGIVSTVAEPTPDPTAALKDFAGQVDMTEKNIDSANTLDELLSSFSGEPKTAKEARNELAGIVGAKDANETPESVLALVQPTLEIMKMSQQMAPAGGIADMPIGPQPEMGVKTPGGFAPAQAQPFQPVTSFQTGGEVSPLSQYLNEYIASRNDPALKDFATDKGDYWTALGLLGAGLAQGKTVAQGLSMGTQLYAPYLQDVRKTERAEKAGALEYALKAKQSDKEAAAATAADELKFQRDLALKEMELAAKDERPQAVREADALLQSQGMVPGSEEYKAAFPDTLKMFAITPGTTVNMGDKLSNTLYSSIIEGQKKRVQEIDADVELANSQAASADAISSIVKGQGEGNFVTGVGAPTRALIGDSLSLLGIDPKRFDLIGDPAQADVLEAETAKLGLAEAQNLARVTNMQVKFAQDSYPILTRTPKGNLILSEMVRRRAARAKKLGAYKNVMLNTYQHLNPTYLTDAIAQEVIPGLDKSTFVTADASSPFDANGKPVMNYDDYVSYLDRTEPLFDDQMKDLITTTVAESPNKLDVSSYLSLFGNASPAPNTGTPTVGEVVGTPGVDVSGSSGETFKGDFINRGGKPMVWDNRQLKYVPYTGAP